MSAEWNKINEFLLTCGDKRSLLPFGRSVLQEIDRLIPFDQGRFYVLDANGKVVDYYAIGVCDNRVEDYFAFYANCDELECSIRSVATRFASHYPAVEHCIRDRYSYDNAESFFSDYVRPNRIEYSFGLGLRDNFRSLRSLFSLDRTSDVRFSNREIGTMKIVRTHLDNLHQNLFVDPNKEFNVQNNLSQIYALTNRENEIADLLIEGVIPPKIGERLFISIATVNKHLANMHKKLGVNNRQELVIKLIQVRT